NFADSGAVEPFLGLFSKQIAFYEDGSKKPESCVSIEERNAYYEQNRSISKKHININAESIEAIDMKEFVSLCKKIHATISNEKSIFLKENQSNEEESIEQYVSLPNVFFEIRSYIVYIKLCANDKEVSLNSFNTHITI